MRSRSRIGLDAPTTSRLLGREGADDRAGDVVRRQRGSSASSRSIRRPSATSACLPPLEPVGVVALRRPRDRRRARRPGPVAPATRPDPARPAPRRPRARAAGSPDATASGDRDHDPLDLAPQVGARAAAGRCAAPARPSVPRSTARRAAASPPARPAGAPGGPASSPATTTVRGPRAGGFEARPRAASHLNHRRIGWLRCEERSDEPRNQRLLRHQRLVEPHVDVERARRVPLHRIEVGGAARRRRSPTSGPKMPTWSVVWLAPVPRSRAGRSAVTTTSGTPAWAASSTAGCRFATAVPDVHITAARAPTLERPSARKPADRSSIRVCSGARGRRPRPRTRAAHCATRATARRRCAGPTSRLDDDPRPTPLRPLTADHPAARARRRVAGPPTTPPDRRARPSGPARPRPRPARVTGSAPSTGSSG